jgi:hypothetical protein
MDQPSKKAKMEHENEVERLKKRIYESEKENNELRDSYENIIQKLKDKIECPVCMEIPRSGPVPVCPNGHFVCNECKTESCPTCRSNMGSNKSVLAGTVIDNIEHKCKFEDCEQNFFLAEIDKHEELCPRRSVTCPHPTCIKNLPLSKLLEHLINGWTCSMDNASVILDSINNTGRITFNVNGDVFRRDMTWLLRNYSFCGVDFVVYPRKREGRYYFVIVMFSSEADCSKYTVELEVHEFTRRIQESYKRSHKFCGNPISIDVEKSQLDFFGISERSMTQIFNMSEDKSTSFTIMFNITKNL